VIDNSFWDRLRVKALLENYIEGFIEYAKLLQDEYSLTDEHIIGVIKMVDTNKLSKLSAMWKKVKPIQPSFSNVPDGDYIGDLKEMKLAESKKSGRLQVEMTFEVADGEYEGKTVKRFDGVEEETGMGYFKNLCEVIGFDIPDDMNVWQEEMDAFVAGNTTDLYDITIKTNDKYANVYVNSVSEYTKAGGEGGEVVEEEAVAEEVVEEVAEEEYETVEEQQVVTPPVRRVLAKPATKAIVKAAAQPIRKVNAAVSQPVQQGGRKIVSLKRK